MAPKTILLDLFAAQVTPWLQAQGFDFIPSQFSYKRKQRGFSQVISVTLSHRNDDQSMVFWTAFNVSSPIYDRWLKEQGREPFKSHLGGCNDWNIPDWSEVPIQSTTFDFTEPARRSQAIASWKDRCLKAGLPYLEALSSWDGLANDLLRNNWCHERAADFFLIAGDVARSIQALETGVAHLQTRDFTVSVEAHPQLVSKRKREAAQRDAEVKAYEMRIINLRSIGGRN